jgi:hypothetical protein
LPGQKQRNVSVIERISKHTNTQKFKIRRQKCHSSLKITPAYNAAPTAQPAPQLPHHVSCKRAPNTSHTTKHHRTFQNHIARSRSYTVRRDSRRCIVHSRYDHLAYTPAVRSCMNRKPAGKSAREISKCGRMSRSREVWV